MGFSSREVSKIAEYHTEQADSLERESHQDGLFGPREAASRRTSRAAAIKHHRARAAELNTEAETE